MSGFTSEQMTLQFQYTVGIIIGLMLGPWQTIIGIRCLKQIKNSSLESFSIRFVGWFSSRAPIARGNIYIWALLILWQGILGNLVVVISFAQLVGLHLK